MRDLDTSSWTHSFVPTSKKIGITKSVQELYAKSCKNADERNLRCVVFMECHNNFEKIEGLITWFENSATAKL